MTAHSFLPPPFPTDDPGRKHVSCRQERKTSVVHQPKHLPNPKPCSSEETEKLQNCACDGGALLRLNLHSR